jgi:hypothetical protein
VRFAFHVRQPFTRQLLLVDALRAGAAIHGDDVRCVRGFEAVEPVDGLILFGIGGISRQIFDAYRATGRHVVFFDKGYTRGGSGHFRVAVNAFQPLAYFQTGRPADRFDALDLELRPYKAGGRVILLDGASNKYALWQGFGDFVSWGARMVERIRTVSSLPIVYRPRPTHNAPVAVPGAELSTAPLREDFAAARVVVSWGGNIGWDAAVAGVPHFAAGDSIARPISETDWARLEEPYIPSDAARRQWCADVAYCQFTLDELADGYAWAEIRRWL